MIIVWAMGWMLQLLPGLVNQLAARIRLTGSVAGGARSSQAGTTVPHGCLL
jgi:hypothetical protein